MNTSIFCSTISNIANNLNFTTIFNDSSILVSIMYGTIWISRLQMIKLATSQYQPRLSSMANVAQDGPTNRIAVSRAN
jgi:hypothetical protein